MSVKAPRCIGKLEKYSTGPGTNGTVWKHQRLHCLPAEGLQYHSSSDENF